MARSAQAREPELNWLLTTGDSSSGLLPLAQSVAARVKRNASRQDRFQLTAQASVNASAALTKLTRNMAQVAVLPGLLVLGQGDLVTLAVLRELTHVLLVRAGDKAVGLRSLAGRRIALGPAAGDLSALHASLLGVLGLENYTALHSYAPQEGLQQLLGGQVDAVVVDTRTLSPFYQRALELGQIAPLQFGKGDLEQLRLRAPTLAREEITLPGGSTTTAIKSDISLIGKHSLPATGVQRLLALYWYGQEIDADLPLTLPLHPAAEKFYLDMSKAIAARDEMRLEGKKQ